MQQHQLQELPVRCCHAVRCCCRPARLVPADQLLHCAVGAEAWQLDGVVALNQLTHILKRQPTLGCAQMHQGENTQTYKRMDSQQSRMRVLIGGSPKVLRKLLWAQSSRTELSKQRHHALLTRGQVGRTRPKQKPHPLPHLPQIQQAAAPGVGQPQPPALRSGWQSAPRCCRCRPR